MVIFQSIGIILMWHCAEEFHHLLPFRKGKRDKIKIYFLPFNPQSRLSGRLCDSFAVTRNKYCINFLHENWKGALKRHDEGASHFTRPSKQFSDLLRGTGARKESDDRMLVFLFFSRFITISSFLVHQKVAERCFKHISLELWRQRRKNLLGLEQSWGCRTNTKSCFNDN